MTSHAVVIIPFYQSEPGILARALHSVFSQKQVDIPRVILIDDGSPIDPTRELAELSSGFRSYVEIIRQKNAGPGAARNRGLLAARARSDIIAFLDSDDIWEPTHLYT